MADFSEQLFSLLASPYSYIQIRTFEEDRTVRLVKALATAMGRPITEWAPTEAPTESLLSLLKGIPQQAPRSVWIVKDAHPYLSNPVIVRHLRELEPVLGDAHSAMVLVSPFVEVPGELIKEITILDAPLPGRVELNTLFDEVFHEPLPQAVSRDRLVAAAMGLTFKETRRAYHRARFEMQQAHKVGLVPFDLEGAVIREKRRLIEIDRVVELCEVGRGFADVGGLDLLKGWLKDRELAFSPQAAAFGLPVPKGVLLTGVQGCGKSLFAKVIAGFWGVPLLRLDIGRLFDGAAAPESALHRAIQTAEALAPAVLWVDELDKGFGDLAGGTASRVMGSFLYWLQDKDKPVFVAATANQVTVLPPELLRKGRFDEIFFVDLPDLKEREEILGIHLARLKRQIAPVDIRALAERTEFFSGAELEQVVVSGLYRAFARQRDLLAEDLKTAAEETVPLYRTCEDEIKSLRQWAGSRARPASQDKKLIDLFKPRPAGR